MKRAALLLGCVLTACMPQVTNPYFTACEAEGYKHGSEDWQDCVTDKAEIEAEAQRRLLVEQKKAQMESDKATCRDYGFKKGSKDFAGCMLLVSQAREQKQHQAELQERALAEQREQERRQNSLALLGLLNQQQAINAANRPRTTNCIASGPFLNCQNY